MTPENGHYFGSPFETGRESPGLATKCEYWIVGARHAVPLFSESPDFKRLFGAAGSLQEKPFPHGVLRSLLAAATVVLLLAWSGGSPILFGQSQPGASALNDLGSRHLRNGEFEKALEQFQAAAKLRPADPAIQFNVGLALFRLGRLREALDPLAAAKTHPPSAKQAKFLRGIIFFQFKELDSCAGELEDLRDDSQYGEHTLYMLIESYRKLGKVQESQQAFLELGKRYPDSAFGHKLMGMAYDAQQRYREAAREFEAALRVNSRMPEIAFAIGYIRWKQKDYEAARPWFEKELVLQPCYARAHHYLGEIARMSQNWRQARVRYEKAIECNADIAGPYVGFGTILDREGKYAEAVQMYRKAILLDPGEAEPHYKLARALGRIGRGEEAKSEFQLVREILASSREKAAKAMDPRQEASRQAGSK